MARSWLTLPARVCADCVLLLAALLRGHLAVQAMDALTPLGRGQAQLVTGARGAGKTALVLDAVLAQARSGVRCIFAAVGHRCAARTCAPGHCPCSCRH